jgi:hypothetical protein
MLRSELACDSFNKTLLKMVAHLFPVLERLQLDPMLKEKYWFMPGSEA